MLEYMQELRDAGLSAWDDMPLGDHRPWQGEVCKSCGHRNVVGFRVSDEVWEQVAPTGVNILCPTCFDELAESKGVRYEFLETFPVTWSMWDDE